MLRLLLWQLCRFGSQEGVEVRDARKLMASDNFRDADPDSVVVHLGTITDRAAVRGGLQAHGTRIKEILRIQAQVTRTRRPLVLRKRKRCDRHRCHCSLSDETSPSGATKGQRLSMFRSPSAEEFFCID